MHGKTRLRDSLFAVAAWSHWHGDLFALAALPVGADPVTHGAAGGGGSGFRFPPGPASRGTDGKQNAATDSIHRVLPQFGNLYDHGPYSGTIDARAILWLLG